MTTGATYDVLVSRPVARKIAGGISESTEWRRLKGDPQWPKLSADGRHYRLADVQRYLALEGTQRVNPELSRRRTSSKAAVTKAAICT